MEVLDLGEQPEANSFPEAASDPGLQPRWPLRLLFCRSCHLAQLDDAGPSEATLPGPAPYELSETLRAHATGLVDDALAHAGSPGGRGRVVEMASHGGHLAPFLADRGIQSLIVEGSPGVAASAEARGRRVEPATFGRDTAQRILNRDGPADLILDNYLLAHLVDPDDMVAGLAILLRRDGMAVLEMDHLLPLIEDRRFDSIRHGHYSYVSLIALSQLLERHGLRVVDASRQPVYGGALRVFVRHAAGEGALSRGVDRILDAERDAGLDDVPAFEAFATGVRELQARLRSFLEDRRRDGEVVAAYGAPSRGNTLLNASGIDHRLLAFTVDRSTTKHGRVLPGSGIPIRPITEIRATRPAYVLILTWDLRAEVISALPEVPTWGGRFLVPLPRFEVI